jgi:hypothetical protein
VLRFLPSAAYRVTLIVTMGRGLRASLRRAVTAPEDACGPCCNYCTNVPYLLSQLLFASTVATVPSPKAHVILPWTAWAGGPLIALRVAQEPATGWSIAREVRLVAVG